MTDQLRSWLLDSQAAIKTITSRTIKFCRSFAIEVLVGRTPLEHGGYQFIMVLRGTKMQTTSQGMDLQRKASFKALSVKTCTLPYVPSSLNLTRRCKENGTIDGKKHA